MYLADLSSNVLLVRVAARNLSVSFEYEKTISCLFLALVFQGSRFLGYDNVLILSSASLLVMAPEVERMTAQKT